MDGVHPSDLFQAICHCRSHDIPRLFCDDNARLNNFYNSAIAPTFVHRYFVTRVQATDALSYDVGNFYD